MNEITLKDFICKKETFQASYGEVSTTKYVYEEFPYKIVVFPTMNGQWWMANIYKDKKFFYETRGRKNPEEVLVDVNTELQMKS